MKFPWVIRRVQKTPAEEKLEEVKNLLFPELQLKEELDQQTGMIFKYHVDYGVDSNLDAVLMDLQEGYNDAATQKTISNIIKRLNAVRKELSAEAKIHKDAKYLVVDDGLKDEDVSEITPIEN